MCLEIEVYYIDWFVIFIALAFCLITQLLVLLFILVVQIVIAHCDLTIEINCIYFIYNLNEDRLYKLVGEIDVISS